MVSTIEKMSGLNVFKILGMDSEEYHLAVNKKLGEALDVYVESEYPNMLLVCDVLRDKLESLKKQEESRDVYSDSQREEYEFFRSNGIFTETNNVTRYKIDTAKTIRKRHSNNLEEEYNDFVQVLEEAYVYGLKKENTIEGVNHLHICFANDFYKVSSEYLLTNGVTDFNTRLSTRRSNVDQVVEFVKKK